MRVKEGWAGIFVGVLMLVVALTLILGSGWSCADGGGVSPPRR